MFLMFSAILPRLAVADLQQGLTAFEKKDYAAAEREIKPLAKQGDPIAQYHLARTYDHAWMHSAYADGLDVTDTAQAAIKWYTLAAEQGYAPAQSALGDEYAEGFFVPNDIEIALNWHNLAAEQGYAPAQFELGRAYERGQGVPQNYETAMKWYALAANGGSRYGQMYLEKLEQKISLQNSLLSKFEKTDSDCIEENANIEVQKRCLEKYFFYDGSPIHPKIIEDFNTWISDGSDQVVAINIEGSQHSNRYCCEDDVKSELRGVNDTFASIVTEDEGWFSYQFLGTTDSGVMLVRIFENGGGSGVFSTALLLRIRESTSIEMENSILLVSKKRRIHLEKLGAILLGDRENHEITVDGNSVVLDGKKMLVPSIP